MKSNSLNPVYKTYIKLCKETNAVPIKKKEFEIAQAKIEEEKRAARNNPPVKRP